VKRLEKEVRKRLEKVRKVRKKWRVNRQKVRRLEERLEDFF